MDLHTSPVGWSVIGASIEVHRRLGPGLLESAYEQALATELRARAVPFEQQVRVPASYKGTLLRRTYRVDFVIAGELVVEIKHSGQLVANHRAQLRTYMRLLNVRQGLLLNFGYPRLIDGLTSLLLPEREEASRP